MRKKRGKYLFLNELSQYTYYVHNTHYPQGKIERRENIGGGGGDNAIAFLKELGKGEKICLFIEHCQPICSRLHAKIESIFPITPFKLKLETIPIYF